MTLLFVYGSLKRGGAHHDLMTEARFVGEAQTSPGYGLVSLGDYLALVQRPGSTSRVDGELFEVSSALVRELDVFEGDEYARLPVPVREKSGEFRLALAYAKKPG
jgi:gamma-glutamylaminecyclotransferase